MSILTALRTADRALSAAGVAIRTVGHNIANAGNENYNRQRVVLSALPPSPDSNLLVGTGVEVGRVERIVSDRIELSLRNATARSEFLGAQNLALSRLEGIFNELQGDGLGESIAAFFREAQNLENMPADPTARRLFTFASETLAATFRQRDQEIRELHEDLNTQIEGSVGEINRLAGDIASLNDQIIFAEAGDEDRGAANDLRDERDAAIRELATILDISVVETPDGAVNVSTGSDLLVEGTNSYAVVGDTVQEGDLAVTTVEFARNGKALAPSGGSLGGLLAARDDTVGKYRSELDQLAAGLIFEINKVHAAGVGLQGRSSMTSSEAVDSITDPLDAAGLPFAPKTGSFDIKVRNEITGQTSTYNIHVDLDGLGGDDTSLQDLVNDINAAVQTDFPALSASITSQLELRIESSDANVTFSFAGDTSDVLAALGAGALFTGSKAANMGVAGDVAADPNLIATARLDDIDAGPADAANIRALVALREAKVMQNGQSTFEEFYRGVVGVLGVENAQTRKLIEHQNAVNEHLRNERAAFSGVNVDEESIELIKFQRMYQGAARYLGVVDSVLQELLNIL